MHVCPRILNLIVLIDAGNEFNDESRVGTNYGSAYKKSVPSYASALQGASVQKMLINSTNDLGSKDFFRTTRIIIH